MERAASKHEPEVNFLFSTAVSDEVVLKWRFETESPFWELDCNNLVTVEEDVAGKKRFNELVKEVKNFLRGEGGGGGGGLGFCFKK